MSGLGYSLEVAGGADVSLGQLLPFALGFLLLLGQAAVHHVVHVGVVVVAHIVDLRVLNVNSCHG